MRWDEEKKKIEMGFLKKEGDKKGHVFELLFSDELYNSARGGEKRSFFGINRSTFLFLENKVTTR